MKSHFCAERKKLRRAALFLLVYPSCSVRALTLAVGV